MPIFIDPFHGRPGKVAPIGAYHPFSNCFVITVEDKGKIGIKRPVSRRAFKDKFLKEPAAVPQMPFGRGDVLYGLYHIVLDFKGGTKVFCSFSGFQEKIQKSICKYHFAKC
jgi:hypothetical protein